MIWTPFEQAGPCWKSGLYKIVYYQRISAYDHGRPGYAAYYIRKGDKNWGYHVDPRSPYYDKLEEVAKALKLSVATK